MATLTLGERQFGFIIATANGDRSFGTGSVAGAAAAGEMIRDNGGTWQPITATETPEAILCEAVAAGDTEARTVVLRDATVTKEELVYPTGATAAQITAIDAALVALGIIPR